MGVAGNKSDLYFKEEVSEEEARKYSNEINAIFRLTSALNGSGISELFKAVGNSFLEPEYQDILEKEKIEENKSGISKGTVKLEKNIHNDNLTDGTGGKGKKKKMLLIRV